MRRATIVGVAPSIPQNGARSAAGRVLPLRVAAPATVAARASTLEPPGCVALLRREDMAIDQPAALSRANDCPGIADMQWAVRVSVRDGRYVTLLSLALATVGLYAVTSQSVSAADLGDRRANGAGCRASIQIVSLVVLGVSDTAVRIRDWRNRHGGVGPRVSSDRGGVMTRRPQGHCDRRGDRCGDRARRVLRPGETSHPNGPRIALRED